MRTRFCHPPVVCIAAMLAACLTAPHVVNAQRPRDELIARAFGEFDPENRLELLLTAADPQLGPPDSVWTFGIQVLVQTLLDQRQDSLASLWARWAVRRLPGFRLDSLQFLPEMIAVFRRSEDFVRRSSGAGDSVVRAAWEWPTRAMDDASGYLRVAPAPAVPLQIRVDGAGVPDPGALLRIPVGSHVVEASADGYETARVTREVLPGITTDLTFTLRPAPGVLTAAVEGATLRSLVRITTRRLGEAGCATGFLAGRDGLIVTTYRSIRGAEQVAVEIAGRRTQAGVRVAAYDMERDVAVLHAPVSAEDSLVIADTLPGAGFVWAFRHPNCGDPSHARTRLATGGEGPPGSLRLADAPPALEQGGPVIDQEGAVVGLGARAGTAIPGRSVVGLLGDARRNAQAAVALTVADVARRENHLYGAMSLTSPLPDALARITPLEGWQWPEVGRTDSLPFTFSGPMGRYQVELLIAGELKNSTEMTLRPGSSAQLVLAPPRRGIPVAIPVLGAIAGVGAVVALLAAGGGNGPTTSQPSPGPGIIIRFP